MNSGFSIAALDYTRVALHFALCQLQDIRYQDPQKTHCFKVRRGKSGAEHIKTCRFVSIDRGTLPGWWF